MAHVGRFENILYLHVEALESDAVSSARVYIYSVCQNLVDQARNAQAAKNSTHKLMSRAGVKLLRMKARANTFLSYCPKIFLPHLNVKPII